MADVRIVPSRAIAEDFAKLSGLKREAFTLLPNPVSAPDAPIAVGPEIAMLWGTSSLRILSVGALKPEKNHARWRDHLSGRRNSTPAIWAILMFQAWLREQKASQFPAA